MSQIEYEQTVAQELEQQSLLTMDSYTKWLYENFTITNGDMLIGLLESGDVEARYLREHGLPDSSMIGD